jgi:hypothetical protein
MGEGVERRVMAGNKPGLDPFTASRALTTRHVITGLVPVIPL